MNKETVLITGGHGFVGCNLWEYICKSEMLIDTYNFYRFSSKQLNLMDPLKISKIFEKYKPDYIIHLAAVCGGIGMNQLYPAIFWDNNLLMAAYLMKASVNYGVKKFITLGSVCSYGKNTPVPFREEDLYTELPEITNRAYGIAKYAIYEGLRAYNAQFNLPFTYLIPTNMYGKYDNIGQQNSHVIPAIMVAMHQAKELKLPEVKLWGDGTPSRDFLYATDTVRAIISSLDCETGNQPINLGTGEEMTMAGLAELIAYVVGYKGDILWDSSKPNGQPRRSIDYSRATEILMWEPEVKLLDGLQETYKWFLELPNQVPKPQATKE